MRINPTLEKRPGKHRPGIWIGFLVPDDVVEAIAGDAASERKRIPVVVTCCGHTHRSSISRQEDGWEFVASLEFREKTGTSLGDTIEADIELDTGERDIPIPEDVASELASTPGGRSWWDSLSYSHRREIMTYVDDARRPETRAKRIRRILDQMDGRG